jgi:hypothetical protein
LNGQIELVGYWLLRIGVDDSAESRALFYCALGGKLMSIDFWSEIPPIRWNINHPLTKRKNLASANPLRW